LGGATKHLINGSVKHICQLSLEFKSPHVIERRSNARFAINDYAGIFKVTAFNHAKKLIFFRLSLSVPLKGLHIAGINNNNTKNKQINNY